MNRSDTGIFFAFALTLTLSLSTPCSGKDAVEEAIKAAERAAEDAARAAEEAAEQAAEDAARAAEDAAEQAAEDAARTTEKAAEEAAEDAARAAEKAAEKATKDAARAAEDAAEESARAAEDAADELEDRLKAERELQEDHDKALRKNQRIEDSQHKSARHRNKSHSEKNSFNKYKTAEWIDNRSVISRLTRDINGHEIIRDETLTTIPLKNLPALEKKLGRINSRQYPGLGIALIKERNTQQRDKPASEKSPDQQKDTISSPNHIYYGVAGLDSNDRNGLMPDSLSQWSSTYRMATPSIGVIDTALPAGYQIKSNGKLSIRSFVDSQIQQPTDHGMAVVSILGADNEIYRGLLPRSTIYLASVFEKDENGVTRTSTERLVEAINWMVEMQIPVINMSLTGPPNAILENAIQQAYQKGTTVVSAAGNAGPHAAPLYPSAYDNVVAVTAVSAKKKIYRMANRGQHIDFAAPGVDILHPGTGPGILKASSGTSMAAPFVAALLAAKCAESGTERCPVENILESIRSDAEDLGEPGYDPVYGHGLVVR